jgi:puromycin-sensitive aminopeptidase
MPEQRAILPSNPTPIHYALEIVPDRASWTFTGTVAIELNASEAVSTVTCNSVDLHVVEARVTMGNRNVQVTRVTYDKEVGRVSFQLAEDVAGDFVLHVQYTGEIIEKLCGYYRAESAAGVLGTTQFEAVDARRALPCWDEPNRKATFQLTLVVPSDEVALSNTSEESVTEDGGKRRVRFQRTPKMSTYLLAWTHGRLDFIETTVSQTHSQRQTRIRLYAQDTAAKDRGQFALEVASRCLPLYENFFGSDYVLDKCDLIAIPNFAAGAMENWGLVTYRETALLCDKASSSAERARVAIIVAHELAHQWFGNLVTMDWWRELWLNEAFATWVEYWAVDTLYPAMNIWAQFVSSDAVSAFDHDARTSSHAIEVDINNAEEVDDIFDAISYCKGCCILRMIIDFIGIDAFRTGVAAYLKQFTFSNATTVDLWRFLGEASGRDLVPILAKWTGCQGYPWISASREGENLILEQHRFLASGVAPASEDTVIWPVPLTILFGRGSESNEHRLLLDQRTNAIPIPPGTEWVRVNKGGSTFVRVRHSQDLHIASAVPHLSALDRLALASDQRAFALAGHIDAEEMLANLLSWSNETDASVIKSVASLQSTLRKLVPDPSRPRFDEVSRDVFCNFREVHGLLPRDADAGVLNESRAVVTRILARANDDNALRVCRDLWASRATKDIPADLRPAVYATMCEIGGEATFDELISMHQKSDTTEGVRCLRALPKAKSETLLVRAAEYALSTHVRSQDCLSVLASLPTTAEGAKVYVGTVKQHWRTLSQKIPPMLLGRLLQGADEIQDSDLIDELTTFAATIDHAEFSGVERSFKQGIEGARNLSAWVRRFEARFVDALNRS